MSGLKQAGQPISVITKPSEGMLSADEAIWMYESLSRISVQETENLYAQFQALRENTMQLQRELIMLTPLLVPKLFAAARNDQSNVQEPSDTLSRMQLEYCLAGKTHVGPNGSAEVSNAQHLSPLILTFFPKISKGQQPSVSELVSRNERVRRDLELLRTIKQTWLTDSDTADMQPPHNFPKYITPHDKVFRDILLERREEQSVTTLPTVFTSRERTQLEAIRDLAATRREFVVWIDAMKEDERKKLPPLVQKLYQEAKNGCSVDEKESQKSPQQIAHSLKIAYRQMSDSTLVTSVNLPDSELARFLRDFPQFESLYERSQSNQAFLRIRARIQEIESNPEKALEKFKCAMHLWALASVRASISDRALFDTARVEVGVDPEEDETSIARITSDTYTMYRMEENPGIEDVYHKENGHSGKSSPIVIGALKDYQLLRKHPEVLARPLSDELPLLPFKESDLSSATKYLGHHDRAKLYQTLGLDDPLIKIHRRHAEMARKRVEEERRNQNNKVLKQALGWGAGVAAAGLAAFGGWVTLQNWRQSREIAAIPRASVPSALNSTTLSPSDQLVNERAFGPIEPATLSLHSLPVTYDYASITGERRTSEVVTDTIDATIAASRSAIASHRPQALPTDVTVVGDFARNAVPLEASPLIPEPQHVETRRGTSTPTLADVYQQSSDVSPSMSAKNSTVERRETAVEPSILLADNNVLPSERSSARSMPSVSDAVPVETGPTIVLRTPPALALPANDARPPAPEIVHIRPPILPLPANDARPPIVAVPPPALNLPSTNMQEQRNQVAAEFATRKAEAERTQKFETLTREIDTLLDEAEKPDTTQERLEAIFVEIERKQLERDLLEAKK